MALVADRVLIMNTAQDKTAQRTVPENSGCGDGSGRWLFEEFNLEDGRLARIVVGYTPRWISMAHDPEYPTGYQFQAIKRFVNWRESVLIGDDLSESPILFPCSWKVEKQVREAFEDDLGEVELYERQWR